MKESDEVLLQDFGLAYDANMNRAIAVFLRYLADLSPEHQQIWNAKQLSESYKLHPDYFRSSILGEWHEGISIFAAFGHEIKWINEICRLIGKPPLFRNEVHEEKRPREFAFLLRPTSRDYNGFVHLLDKLMSENLNMSFFRGDVDLEVDVPRRDGKIEVRHKGTITLLEEWLDLKYRAADHEPVEEMLATFREVRKLRQHPAHAVDENRFGQAYFKQQREIMIRAHDAVRILRLILQSHPLAHEFKLPKWIESLKVWTY